MRNKIRFQSRSQSQDSQQSAGDVSRIPGNRRASYSARPAVTFAAIEHDVHAARPARNANRRDASTTDALCRRSSAVCLARPYRVRSTRVLRYWTSSLQLAACQC